MIGRGEVEEGGEVSPDTVLANATIDRIFDRAEIVLFEGKSYRLKGRIQLPSVETLEPVKPAAERKAAPAPVARGAATRLTAGRSKS